MKKFFYAVLLVVAVLSLSLGAHLFAQGRFIDNKDGTVTDTKTNLMWAK